jgi:PAS domain S-box-containing protein
MPILVDMTLSNSYNIYEDDHLGALIDASPLGIIVLDPTGRVMKWNRASERIFGWREREVLGKMNPVLPEGFDKEYTEQRNKLLSGGSLIGEEYVRKRKDGSFVDMRVYSSLIKDENDSVLGVIAMYEDITEEKKAKDRLLWNDLLLRQMNESTKLGFYAVDNRSEKILFANKRFINIWNLTNIDSELSEGGLKNSEIIELCSICVKDKEKFKSVFLALNDIGNVSVFKDEIELNNGKIISVYTTQLRDKNDNYLCRFFLFEDVSERKIFEALLKNEEEYKKIAEKSSEAVILADLKGKINFVNQNACSLLGLDKEKILAKNLTAVLKSENGFDLSQLSIGKTIITSIRINKGEREITADLNLKLYSPGKVQAVLTKDPNKSRSDNRLHNTFTENQSRFIFSSEVMKKINFELSRLALNDYDVLIEGETGVGKDMAAAQIYLRSGRNKHPFIPVPIGSLNDSLVESELFGHEKGAYSGAEKLKIGKFEAANKGILYIPEISSLPESIQLKLLYFMQYKTITRVGQDARTGEVKLDVRLIMATNENLEELVKKGKIRKDFYYRISGSKIYIPPLRERIDDIETLANHFLELYSECFEGRKFEFSPEVIEAFKKHPWFGNVRELANCVKNSISFDIGPVIQLENISSLLNISQIQTVSESFSVSSTKIGKYESAEYEFKKDYFQKILKQANNKISAAAKLAGMTPQGLRKILRKLKLIT